MERHPAGGSKGCSAERGKCWEVERRRTNGHFLSVLPVLNPTSLLVDGRCVPEAVSFSLRANNVVLATGTHDIPARLGVEGESLPFVHHSFWELEAAICRGELSQTSDPVLVVGAGLTAADAILATHHLNTPVYHVFRRSVTDRQLIFNQLPKLLYPEYHKVRGRQAPPLSLPRLFRVKI